MNTSLKLLFSIASFTVLILTGCKEEGCTDPLANNYEDSANKDDGSCEYTAEEPCNSGEYCFSRAGETTVNFSGQTTRLNQLAEIISVMKSANDGNAVDDFQLLEMYSNNNGTGSSYFSSEAYDSSKQLKNKTFLGMQNEYQTLMHNFGNDSQNSSDAGSNGVAGVVTSTTNPESKYFFDQNGFEYTQLVEKGLMGDCFYYQAMDTYIAGVLSGSYGNEIIDGINYIENEHKFDEAFGYLGIPTDFLTNTEDARFHGKYCNSRDGVLGTNSIFDNFAEVRQAITDGNQDQIEMMMPNIKLEWHRIIAGTAVHYLNAALNNIDDPALKMHELSEAFAFIGNLVYGTEGYNISINQRDECRALLGTNFYETTTADINAAKEWLVNNTAITLIESANL